MRSIDVVVEAVVTFAGAAGFAHTLAPLRRGQQDPCFRATGDGCGLPRRPEAASGRVNTAITS